MTFSDQTGVDVTSDLLTRAPVEQLVTCVALDELVTVKKRGGGGGAVPPPPPRSPSSSLSGLDSDIRQPHPPGGWLRPGRT
jgi:hypothetical protein